MQIRELRIRDVGVIDDVTVELSPGLTVVSGETGAGKTMVVGALQLLRGERADVDQVRAGASQALVEARFAPPPPDASDYVDDEQALVAAREVAAEGASVRSKARLGGRMAPIGALSQILGSSVDVHAQADSVRLADEQWQRAVLDRMGGDGLAEQLSAYQRAWARWRDADAELRRLASDEHERASKLQRLCDELAEIDGVDPRPGEEQDLDAELTRLAHAEELAAAAVAAAEAVGAEGGARDALGHGVAALRPVAGTDSVLDGHAERLEGLAAEAQDLAFTLRAYAEDVEVDEERLAALRARKAALSDLGRKYGGNAAELAEYAARARAEVERLAGGEQRAAELAETVERARTERDDAAAALRAARGAAAERLATEVNGHLADLAMETARFAVEVEPVEPGWEGADRVRFVLAANPGEPALPLAKAASGGERSRVALAVRLALADADDTPVMVFDEIDAGIGGAVASEVGRKLARLALGRQVLCVTHLAQLAAFADAHLTVTKSATAEGRTAARVALLDEDDRIVELSRMLSGATASELAAGHAAELRAAARRM
jgi:DNA repair protein RecN (Recombination protein N)